jgi:hypothetical protein
MPVTGFFVLDEMGDITSETWMDIASCLNTHNMHSRPLNSGSLVQRPRDAIDFNVTEHNDLAFVFER